MLKHIFEKYIDEATFSGSDHLWRHYKKHVLSEGEKFSPENPKFPYMSMREYADRAEQLSLAPHKEIHNASEIDGAIGVIGWKVHNDEWRRDRNMKINIDSPLHKGFVEIVIYVDVADGDNQIFSYMLANKNKVKLRFAEKSGEIITSNMYQ